jgi:hypothetical protein|tara:strand:- start:362 stop:574 length:213 start_codon:yes stop_codon:yes gene_type:complete
MTSVNDNIIDRDLITDRYIKELIEGMDEKSMVQYIYDHMEYVLESYTIDELIAEVEEYDQSLLETPTIND